jgi:methyltransferase (TIGR00027 family)
MTREAQRLVMEKQIEHVSETALMVAACRAIETGQEDGLLRDPYAERLAGERGMEIARSASLFELMCFFVVLRARLMDELLLGTVKNERIETVVNLGAGLDTRPWRLSLPSALRWIDVDFPSMLEYKATRLANERPRCRFEQFAADLSNVEDRLRLFEWIGPRPALMMTEGLLMYLPQATFTALTTEAPQLSGVRYWLLDVSSEDAMRAVWRGDKTPIEHLRPKDHLAGQAILDAAQANGWTAMAARTYEREVAAVPRARLARLVEIFNQADGSPPPSGDPSGIYLCKSVRA